MERRQPSEQYVLQRRQPKKKKKGVICDPLAAEGVLVTASGDRIRMLTHLGITAGDIEAAVRAWRCVTAGTA